MPTTPDVEDIGATEDAASQRSPSVDTFSFTAHCGASGESAANAAPAGRERATAMAAAKRLRPVFLPRDAASSWATAQVPVDTFQINL